MVGLYITTFCLQRMTCNTAETYPTLLALFQTFTSSVRPLVEAYTADSKCQNKQSNSDIDNHDDSGGGDSSDCGSDRTLTPSLRV